MYSVYVQNICSRFMQFYYKYITLYFESLQLDKYVQQKATWWRQNITNMSTIGSFGQIPNYILLL